MTDIIKELQTRNAETAICELMESTECGNLTKISAAGLILFDDAPNWSCVQDNETELMWEKKSSNGGLRDRLWSYMNTTNMNGIDPRSNYDRGACFVSSSDSDDVYCHTEGYVTAVNSVGLCGFNDWRMPTITELETLVEPNETPAIDTNFFPYTNDTPDPFSVHHWWYWSSTPAGDSAAHYMYFELGISSQFGLNRQNSARVRLLRDGQ